MIKNLTPSRFRLAIQFVFTAFCIYVGFEFARFLSWALGQSDTFVAKPGAVEGFLPISALLGLRQLVATGEWDMVHPAGLSIFIAILIMAFLFRKGFCAYICPVGFISNLLERLGRMIGLAKIPPKYLDYPLMAGKYTIAAGFLYVVFVNMSAASVSEFISSPYNMVADAKMMHFFTDPSVTSLTVIAALAMLSILVRNFWCRYLCPYGALLGLVAWLGPSKVERNSDRCIECEKCTKGCPSGIKVHEKSVVRSPECIGCAECVGNCPVEDCLGVRAYRKIKLPWLALGIGTVAVLLAVWAWAISTGHWNAEIPPFMIKKIYPMFLKMS